MLDDACNVAKLSGLGRHGPTKRFLGAGHAGTAMVLEADDRAGLVRERGQFNP